MSQWLGARWQLCCERTINLGWGRWSVGWSSRWAKSLWNQLAVWLPWWRLSLPEGRRALRKRYGRWVRPPHRRLGASWRRAIWRRVRTWWSRTSALGWRGRWWRWGRWLREWRWLQFLGRRWLRWDLYLPASLVYILKYNVGIKIWSLGRLLSLLGILELLHLDPFLHLYRNCLFLWVWYNFLWLLNFRSNLLWLWLFLLILIRLIGLFVQDILSLFLISDEVLPDPPQHLNRHILIHSPLNSTSIPPTLLQHSNDHLDSLHIDIQYLPLLTQISDLISNFMPNGCMFLHLLLLLELGYDVFRVTIVKWFYHILVVIHDIELIVDTCW